MILRGASGMRAGSRAAILLVGLALAAAPVSAAPGAPVTVDSFDHPEAWTAVPADGVGLEVSGEEGALRLDVDFHGGGGYAVVHRDLDLDLPDNYAFTFRVKGKIPPNSLEFKLIDASGDNVWWSVARDMTFPPGWTRRTIRKRNITFAWGPAGGGEIRHVAALEFAVTAGSGGRERCGWTISPCTRSRCRW